MNKEELGLQYLEKAQIIRKKMERLEEELKTNAQKYSRDSQYELKKRIHLLFDMYLDCSIVGKRLLEMNRREEERR